MDQAVVEQVEELVLEQDRLTTCYFCLVGRSSSCALGFQKCPWRNGGLGDYATVDVGLASKDRTGQLL